MFSGRTFHARAPHPTFALNNLLGAVAQWLGRWSLAGGLSLTFARSVVDRKLGDHFVVVMGKLSAVGQPTGPTQPSIRRPLDYGDGDH